MSNSVLRFSIRKINYSKVSCEHLLSTRLFAPRTDIGILAIGTLESCAGAASHPRPVLNTTVELP